MNWETIEIAKLDKGYNVTVVESKRLSYWVYSLDNVNFSYLPTTNTYAVETREGIVNLLQDLLKEKNDPET